MNKGQKKKRRKTRSSRILFILGEKMPDDDEMEDGDRGVYIEKKDVEIIYNAMKHYKPSKDEEQIYEILLEMFDEILVVDYGKPLE